MLAHAGGVPAATHGGAEMLDRNRGAGHAPSGRPVRMHPRRIADDQQHAADGFHQADGAAGFTCAAGALSARLRLAKMLAVLGHFSLAMSAAQLRPTANSR